MSTAHPYTNELESFNLGPDKSTRRLECPLSVMADSYKGTHLLMYPETEEMRAYGTFRSKFEKHDDQRIVVYGIKHYINQFISRTIDNSDVEAGRAFMKLHLGGDILKIPEGDGENPIENAGLDYFDLLKKTGHFPVKIEALPEGSVIYPGVPVYIITAKGENSRLCAFLETILTMVWYPSAVATLSRHTKTLIEDAFSKSVDYDADNPKPYQDLLDTRLHDFGFRGCTCVEQSVLGGAAHLLSFNGSDTMSACYHVTHHLNKGVPVGISLPATEHSVMTSWPDELAAIQNLCERFPGRMVACVMDSYDYENALNKILPLARQFIEKYNCQFVIRPDSGDPVEQVILALQAGERHFGCVGDVGENKGTKNKKGYKVLNRISVIQGDGINYDSVKTILERVLREGYSAQNVAFGMGGGLLQKVNRDTMSFATKLSYTKAHGIEYDSMKCPAGDESKWSLPGKLIVAREITEYDSNPIMSDRLPTKFGPHTVYTEGEASLLRRNRTHINSMEVIYDGNKPPDPASADQIQKFHNETFNDVRKRLNQEWNENKAQDHDPISAGLKSKIYSTNLKIVNRIRAMNGQKPIFSDINRLAILPPLLKSHFSISPTGETRPGLSQNLHLINQLLNKI
jgi:nicotinamide phosphoribosyltransferase